MFFFVIFAKKAVRSDREGISRLRLLSDWSILFNEFFFCDWWKVPGCRHMT